MKYFFDTEFIDTGSTIELLSIGMIAEDGRRFYRQADWTDWTKADKWVENNVLPKLIRRRDDPSWATRAELRWDLIRFCNVEQYGKPEFWAYYADYDWVVLCQVFGRMLDLPKGWPKYCNDIKQYCNSLGNPKLPEQAETTKHHALFDAQHDQVMYEFLTQYEETY